MESESVQETVDKNVCPLQITDSIDALDKLVNEEDTLKKLKRCIRYSHVSGKLMKEFLQFQHDQEKAYILGKRYLVVMDHIFQLSDDQNYTRSMFIADYNRVKRMVDDLKSELEKRYAELRSKLSVKEVLPTTSGLLVAHTHPKSVKIPGEGPLLFSDVFISSNELYGLIKKLVNVLLVDIRNATVFEVSHVHIKAGQLINIAEDLIIPGLSANTLGELLQPDIKSIWEKRDTFEVIVLMDQQSQKFTYEGSKLERLRSFIVEWDFNRTYRQQPVVLIGGIEEYAACYPTEVTNSEIFLSKSNSDMDELLTIDLIDYPDYGAKSRMGLKAHSITDQQLRIQTDFEEDESLKICSSEGHLPVDSYASKDLFILGPFESVSQPSLHGDGSPNQKMFDLGLPNLQPELIGADIAELKEADGELSGAVTDEQQEVSKPSPIDIDMITDTIHKLLISNKDALLKEARATKPGGIGDRGDQDENQHVRDESITAIKSVKPAIDRSRKPTTAPKSDTEFGDGYTGLVNHKNSCYMNCLLQCLKVIPLMKKTYVLSEDYIKQTTIYPPDLNFEMANTLRELWKGFYENPRVYQPSKFKRKVVQLQPQYDKGFHEDTFEFFIFIFNVLSDDCSYDIPGSSLMNECERAWYSHLQGRSSFLVDSFYYQLQNNKQCYNCRTPNFVYETDSTLMLAMPEKTCRLEDLIADYLKDNLIPDYSCTQCHHSATIVNKKEIIVEPEVLVIVLKRYIANFDGGFRKNKSEIEFPLSNLKFGSGYYRLYAIPHHVGTMVSGHYFATVLLNPKKNKWVVFNDEAISHCDIRSKDLKINQTCTGFFYVLQGRGDKA